MTFKNPTFCDIPKLSALWQEAFGDTNEFIYKFFKTVYHDKRCCIEEENGQILSALYVLDCYSGDKKLAYLYAVATKKEHRGKGACRRLIEDTHEYLKANGYDGAILVPGNEELFSLYEKLGYTLATYIDEITVSAENKLSPDLKAIGKEEYQKLRRELLPCDAVLHTDENIAFLETFEELYSADGVLLSAHIKDNTLYAAEFFGDTSLLPSVTFAIGAEKGVFRTVGSDKPFSMYYPFNDDLPKPSYFGPAFD